MLSTSPVPITENTKSTVRLPTIYLCTAFKRLTIVTEIKYQILMSCLSLESLNYKFSMEMIFVLFGIILFLFLLAECYLLSSFKQNCILMSEDGDFSFLKDGWKKTSKKEAFLPFSSDIILQKP